VRGLTHVHAVFNFFDTLYLVRISRNPRSDDFKDFFIAFQSGLNQHSQTTNRRISQLSDPNLRPTRFRTPTSITNTSPHLTAYLASTYQIEQIPHDIHQNAQPPPPHNPPLPPRPHLLTINLLGQHPRLHRRQRRYIESRSAHSANFLESYSAGLVKPHPTGNSILSNAGRGCEQ